MEKTEAFSTNDYSQAALGRRLRAARMALGLSQVELGNLIGRTKTSISGVENGRSYPRTEILVWFYKNHQIDPNYFICGQFNRLPAETCDAIFAILADEIDPAPEQSDQD